MAKRNLVPVTAREIREAFARGEFTARDESLPSLRGGDSGKVRGRISPSAVEDFLAVNPDRVLVKSAEAEVKTVTLPLTKTSARGATLKRPEAFPIAEVRRLAGVEGKRGRLSKEHIAKATAAVMAERGQK